MTARLRLILGDQLNHQHSWLMDQDDNTHYLIAELKQETAYVAHHVQKVCGFFAAMNEFATELRAKGHKVLHLTLDDTAKYDSLSDLLLTLFKTMDVQVFEYQYPDEYRLKQQLEQLPSTNVTINCCDTEHFFVPRSELGVHFKQGKPARMEHFYRNMRRRLDILMEGKQPVGGQWNFDAENRKKLKAQDLAIIPEPLVFENDVTAIYERLQRHEVKTIGRLNDSFLWPINRAQSQQLLDHFCDECLPLFGRFQDAMTKQSQHAWSLYHSRLSFAINTKMLDPMEVVNAALSRYRKPGNEIELASVEGFVRQIIGWREFIRGIYWVNMPAYGSLNALEASRALPDFFWTGETKMQCLSISINQSLDTAYAHHIQRLMITGNFCLITGIDPEQVDQWYLGIYIDAVEWVEMPNTRGMSQFADGGLVGSKPYAASGNYVNKMTDYCKGCHYKVKEKHGDTACPLNSLYWQFMVQHRTRLEKNPRIGMVYRNWDKQSAEQRDATLLQAKTNLINLEQL
ncbi:MAG: deoxyribodipyrimidine photolyase-related protein [Candidatus Azotimanducaceae bacterium]